MKLDQLTIKQAHQGLRENKFSSEELTQACLKRIKKVDKKINAFITVCEKEAIARAKKADKLISDGQKTPVLMGIPFSMKDVYCTKGIRTTAGSKVLKNYIPQYNATVYEKLNREGAVLLGKTNCDAWGHGASTENSDFGPVHNPWDLKYTPGGSSGGCAAALASGMSFFSIGEDTGGSIRLPASFCGIVGLKVTYGRTSRYGAIAFASSLDTVGPFARTVEDCALILNTIAGNDPFDSTTPPIRTPLYTKTIKKGIKGLVIGLPKEFFGLGLNREVKEKVILAAKKLEKLGARIKRINLPTTKYAIAVYYIIAPSETSSNLERYDGIRYGFERENFGDEAKRRIMLGTYALSAGYYEAFYLKAMKVRTLIKREFEEAFKKVDFLLAPVSPTPPFRLGEKVADPLKMYLADIFTVSISLAGIPSLSIPCGFSEKDLPIGLQLIGPQFSEDLLFRVGYAYEQATDWHKRRPKL